MELELGLFLDGNLLPNNSIVLLSDIGEGSEALFCLTPSTDCCSSRGAWRQPNGSEVSGDTTLDFYSSRGNSILLNRRNSATGPTGIFRCLGPLSSIPDSLVQTLYAGIYRTQEEGIVTCVTLIQLSNSLCRTTECCTDICSTLKYSVLCLQWRASQHCHLEEKW